jgi:hypothetical protein
MAATARQPSRSTVVPTEVVPPADTRSRTGEPNAPASKDGDVAAGPTPEEIAERAYEFYQARGGQDGYDVDDWLAAEHELRSLRNEGR